MFERRGAQLGILGVAVAFAGCNAIFGIESGVATGSTTTGSGGSTSSSTATSSASSTGTASSTSTTGGTGTSSGSSSSSGTGGAGGGCGVYDGDGSITWTNDGGANLGSLTFGVSGSIGGTYKMSDGVTSISLGGSQPGFCGMGAHLTLVGPPAPGKAYTIVDKAVADDPVAFKMADNAYLDTGGTVQLDGGCEDKAREFGSAAGGGGGTVKVDAVAGTVVTFTVQGVLMQGLQDAMFMGQGSLHLDISAHADCFITQP
jgi:hypothetical protein